MHLLIVEDHTLVREGLRMILDDSRHFDACSECGSLEVALARVDEIGGELGLVILDLGLPDASGLGVLETMVAACPSTPIIVVSGEDDAALIDAAFAHGARGFVPKNSSGPALRVAVETVLQGELYVPPHVLRVRPSSFPPVRNVHSGPSNAARGADSVAPVRLTPRQEDVLRLVARGLANKEIAEELGMSPSTVRVHVTALFKSLGVENRTQAALSDAAKSLNVFGSPR
jgi:two-component system, NarL family, nitrate/nitrite response regulator NarL